MREMLLCDLLCPRLRGKGGAVRHQRGRAAEGSCFLFSLRAKGAVVWFYQKRRPLYSKGHPPQARRAHLTSGLRSDRLTACAVPPPFWYYVPPSPPQFGRVTKGKCLYGQARRLTSPDLRILCRMRTVDNKPSNPQTLKTQISNLSPSVISSGVEKSPSTMLPAISRGYVAKYTDRLMSESLNVSNYLNPQISYMPFKGPLFFNNL